MLNKISWSSFAVLLAIILIGYYLYVLISYYRKEIFSFGFTNKNSIHQKNRGENSVKSKPIHKEESSAKDNQSDESFTTVHELLEDLKDLFQRASRSRMIKEELIQAIRTKLKTYQGIGESELIEDINTHIILEAKDKCNLEILPGDINQIWD